MLLLRVSSATAAVGPDVKGAAMAFMGGKSSGWAKRFAIAALATAVLAGLVSIADGSATARAFSSPGLPA